MSKSETEFAPNESFLELALDYFNITYHDQYIVFDRSWIGKHKCVKGNYSTEHTCILHPNLHSILDPTIKRPKGLQFSSSILPKNYLHNHFGDYKTVKLVDEVMFKEKTDIKMWPNGTKELTNNGWFAIDDWYFNPRNGQVKHKDYPTVKYHHSIAKKLELGIKTPWIIHYNTNNT